MKISFKSKFFQNNQKPQINNLTINTVDSFSLNNDFEVEELIDSIVQFKQNDSSKKPIVSRKFQEDCFPEYSRSPDSPSLNTTTSSLSLLQKLLSETSLDIPDSTHKIILSSEDLKKSFNQLQEDSNNILYSNQIATSIFSFDSKDF